MKAPATLRKFDQPKDGLHLESVNELTITNHSILTVKTETTGWNGKGSNHGGTASVRFECCGDYQSTMRPSFVYPHVTVGTLEFKGMGQSEIRSLLIGFEFAAASLRLLLNEPPMDEPDENVM
ncbi:MAG: hypothetical protein RLZZ398_1412 [Verrucomicrobiota bacterium]